MTQRWSFLPRDADALLIVPPFFTPYSPGFGAEQIAACARRAGFVVATVYANLSLASTTGLDQYEDLLRGDEELWGERLFCRSAFGLPPLGLRSDAIPDDYRIHRADGLALRSVPASRARALEPLIEPWVEQVAEAIADLTPRAVGFSVHEQSVGACYALADRVKRLQPRALTLFGGPACSGPMAEGILSLGAAVDIVFAGEADGAFVEFLRCARRGTLSRPAIVPGDVDVDLDGLPLPDFGPFLEQVSRFLPEAERSRLCLLYECCRGCWRAPRQQCAFCGFAPRDRTTAKRKDIVLRDLATLGARHPGLRVAMTDPCIHPVHLASTVPALATAPRPGSLAWAVRPDLTLDEVVHLRAAGVAVITVGIESLCTTILERFRKGATARDALAALRYARSVGVLAMWNLLARMPGQRAEEYAEMARLVPLVTHLQPPVSMLRTEVVRFSPYFTRPGDFGLSRLQPIPATYDVFPAHADVGRLASRFLADGMAEPPELEHELTALIRRVDAWSEAWTHPLGDLPELSVRPLTHDAHGEAAAPFLLTDTRGLPGCARRSLLTREEAAVALSDLAPRTAALEAWALSVGAGALVDGRYTPLATACPQLLQRIERGA